MDKQLRVNADPKALKPYSGVENMQVRAKGKSQSLAATVKFMDWWVDIGVDGKLSTIGIKQDTVCELLAPIYST
ncbi:hypothetical protein JY504_08125 [Corynebacterium amycolatum]|uniref:hypothetical protein n=1 Tax=Corynebacterium amycolatum TaxID=43765 RepID=UPI00211A6428|nr:hypothetical protein [Corynebacterium amycolatum]MCQ9125583.1 hypothetical protein [Corynebacterium amycolatum]MCQ9169986.1 hypothetical protein [Corynebacterium amycolatum]MCQ9177003.1 hypothetical protein [Corynebacterium amycolatum]